MSYSIIGAILLAIVALSSSALPSNNERNVLARFYSDFVQLYRPVTLKTYVDQGQTTERYQFFFTEKEFSQISEESLAMLYTNVLERTVTYHPMPNFEVVGTRYFYRRDRTQNDSVEIELVNVDDHLFREVQQPNRYFYLSSFRGLEYSKLVPVMPYYEVTFICNSSVPTDTPTQSPLLSYIDISFQWTPRYLLDLPLVSTNQPSEMYAYADIRNTGGQSIVVKGAELITGDIYLNQRSFENLRGDVPNGGVPLSLGGQASGTHVYQLSLPSSVTIPSHSIKSVEFFQPNVTVEPFVYYSSVFSTGNFNGKLFEAYNITSFNSFIPNGRLLLREQGRFVGQVHLPNLSFNETYTMVVGYDVDVSYRRQVKLIEGNDFTDSVTYNVEYIFENSKLSRDVRVYFIETFNSFEYFEIKNISTSNGTQNIPDLTFYGADLRGDFFIPRQQGEKMVSYNLVLYKFKPTSNSPEQ